MSNPPPKFEIDPRYLWRKFVERAGGHPQVGEDVFRILQKLYGEGHRAYHTLGHISWCLDLLREMGTDEDEFYDRVELALWFHDAVYDPHRKDNEERSARVLIGCAAFLGLPSKIADEAAIDVRATTHTGETPLDDATKWVLDIDLASLGFSPDKFTLNSAQIREEYSWVPEEAYRNGRKIVLQGFLDRPRIYWTEKCYERFEAQARENLKKAIESLG